MTRQPDYLESTLYGPPADRDDDTVANSTRRPDWQSGQPMVRAFSVRPNSFDPEKLTVEVVAATEAPVGRMDAKGRFY